MKKMMICVISLLLSAVLFSLPSMAKSESANNPYGFSGAGTFEDPYLIEDLNDLIVFRDAVNAGESFSSIYFHQTADIDLKTIENWTSIGEVGTGASFLGVYDGCGNRIYNLRIRGDRESYVGFFGLLGGSVYNLGIESGSISGGYSGTIACHAGNGQSSIINCYNKASVEGNRAGGIADTFIGTILYSWNTGKLTAWAGTPGGIVGNDGALVKYCQSTDYPVVPYSTWNGTLFNNKTYDQGATVQQMVDTNNSFIGIGAVDNNRIYYRQVTGENKDVPGIAGVQELERWKYGFSSVVFSVLLMAAMVAFVIYTLLKINKEDKAARIK